MRNVQIHEVSLQQMIVESTMPDDELEMFKSCQKTMILYSGYIDGKLIFHCGIINYEEGKGEVWSRIEDDKSSMAAALNIRELIEHIYLHHKYEEITASVIQGSEKLQKWMKWLGFQYVTSSEMNNIVFDHYLWRQVWLQAQQ